MLKLGKLTDYATVLLAAMAVDPARLHPALELGRTTGVAQPTVAKLMKLLGKGGLVSSVRGAHGGYRLAQEPSRVTVADVIRALEGPIAVTDCAVHEGDCAIESRCAARSTFRLINLAVTQALEAVSLADMAATVARSQRSESPLHFLPITSPVSRHEPHR